LWNLAITLLAALNSRLDGHRPINIAVDLVVSLALFALSGDISGPLSWSAVLVIFSSSIYYEWRGSLASGLVITLLQIGWIYFTRDVAPSLTLLGLLAGVNLLIALVVGSLSMLLMRAVRKNYHRHVNQKQSGEKVLVKQERERLHVFYSMVETLSASLNYQVVLDTALNLGATALGSEQEGAQLVSAVLLFEAHDLAVKSSRRFTPADSRLMFPAEKGALAESFRSGEIVALKDPAQDAELGSVFALQNCHSALILPLRRGLTSYGMMLFAHPSPEFFSEECKELLEMISHQAVIAIQNARLYQDLEEEKERLVETQEEARKKLARDLHDGPTQSVAALAMRINIARKMLERNPQETDEELQKIEELARRTTQEIRHMLFTLRPLVLESEGLIAALNAMADKMRDLYHQNVVVDADSQLVEQIEMGKQTVIFYLAEEAVNNARKHAQASIIRVQLKPEAADPEIAVLEIADNGLGFDVAAVNREYEKRGSLGMVNLRERTDLVNGLLDLTSIPGKGTRVRVFIPLSEEASDRLQRGRQA
jgi:signal transduction histidine kinase